MGFFKSVGKAFKKVGKAVGGVAIKAVPSVLSVAKNVIPGGNIVAGAVSTVAGMVGGKGGGDASPFTSAIAEGLGGPGIGASSVGRVGTAPGGDRKKVVIWR